jgi:glycosyltransferase involved in cell wall biosynthesis
MRVVVNLLAATGNKTGIGHYTAELLRCLHEQAGDDQIEVFPRGPMRWARRIWARVRPILETKKATSLSASGTGANASPPGVKSRMLASLRRKGQRLLRSHFHALCERGKFDLYHEPNFIPLPSDVPTVATLHDLSVLLHPEWHPADRVAHFERHFRAGVARCCHYFAISEFGRQEVIRHLGIPPERVTRTYMGIRPGLAPLPREIVAAVLKKLNLPPRYLLCLGTIEPRKNVLLLLKAYCSLPASVREQWPLLLVGGWGWNTADVAAYLHAEAKQRGVIHLGYVANEQIPALYNGARALVYPSLYEGFGLPPIEMMACGGAVLASTAGALVETVGCKAHLVEPLDFDGWRAALTRVVQDADWWQSLRTGAEDVARPFTWDACAADTLRVYRQLTTSPLPHLVTHDRAA